MGPISHRALVIQASLSGWSVTLDGQPLTSSWSRALAEDAAMEEALNIRRSGMGVEVLVRGLFGPARTVAQEGAVPAQRGESLGAAALWAAAEGAVP